MGTLRGSRALRKGWLLPPEYQYLLKAASTKSKNKLCRLKIARKYSLGNQRDFRDLSCLLGDISGYSLFANSYLPITYFFRIN